MKTSVLALFTAVLLTLSFPGCNTKKPGITEESFLGEWYTIKGNVEAYSFLKDDKSYIFTGTRGMRPVVYGSWKIEKEKFIITMDKETTATYDFVLSNDTLIFNAGEQIYTRTEPLYIRYPEVRILISVSGDFSTLKFSEPVPDDLDWGFMADSTQSSQKFSLKGYSISARTTLSSRGLSEISNYLQEKGYERDTIYITDMCIGFRDDNQIITVCTSQDTQAAEDSIYIQITSGLIIK